MGQLRTENKRLNEALAETSALRERITSLEVLVEELDATKGRLGQLQAAHERTQREHASMSTMVVRLEDKLRQVGRGWEGVGGRVLRGCECAFGECVGMVWVGGCDVGADM